MQYVEEQIMDIIRDPSKTRRQTVFALAELAGGLCDYPAGARSTAALFNRA